MKSFLLNQLPRIIFGRHSAAILIAFAPISLLYFQFQSSPAGADSQAALKIHQLEQMMPVQMAELDISSQSSESESTSGHHPAGLSGKSALMMNLLLLEKGHAQFSEIPDYTANFFRQERLNGKMEAGELLQIKIRHTPFSVYMKWLSGAEGQEVIYVDGKNDGNMIVHPGGWKSKLVASVELDPFGSTAMSKSHHPITNAGVLNLTKKLIKNRKRDIDNNIGLQSRMLDDQLIDDRECYCFVIEFTEADREILGKEDQYRKSIVYIDKDQLLPIFIQNYTWLSEDQIDATNIDEITLIERYSYKKIQPNQKFASKDFDQANREYNFIRR